MRSLTTATRRQLEEIMSRLSNGEAVSLAERIRLQKYALHIPFISLKLKQALHSNN